MVFLGLGLQGVAGVSEDPRLPLAGQSRLCDTGLLLVSIKLSPKYTLTNIQTELSVEFHPNGTVL